MGAASEWVNRIGVKRPVLDLIAGRVINVIEGE